MKLPPPIDLEQLSLSRREKIRLAVLRWSVIGVAALAHRAFMRGGLEQTSLLFIGIPTLLGVGFALIGPRRHAVLSTVRGLLLAFVVAFALLGEGAICIIMAAPLFLIVAVVVQLAQGAERRPKTKDTVRGLVVIGPLVLMSFEGVHENLSFSREERVIVERTVALSSHAVEDALARPMAFDRPLPAFLRLGFPRPQWAHGNGLEVGDRRVIEFGRGEIAGALVLEVTERAPHRARFRAVTDRSKIAHWLGWRGAEVVWDAQGDSTRVRWTLEYERRLDPAWYFGPLERHAVRLAAEFLIANLAPVPARSE